MDGHRGPAGLELADEVIVQPGVDLAFDDDQGLVGQLDGVDPARRSRPDSRQGRPPCPVQRPARLKRLEGRTHNCGIESTHLARQAGGVNGSAKYWVSWATLPSWNSMMLIVDAGFPS